MYSREKLAVWNLGGTAGGKGSLWERVRGVGVVGIGGDIVSSFDSTLTDTTKQDQTRVLGFFGFSLGRGLSPLGYLLPLENKPNSLALAYFLSASNLIRHTL